eukprot:12264050-Heterocapsa_arctica.AAC.1
MALRWAPSSRSVRPTKAIIGMFLQVVPERAAHEGDHRHVPPGRPGARGPDGDHRHVPTGGPLHLGACGP